MAKCRPSTSGGDERPPTVRLSMSVLSVHSPKFISGNLPAHSNSIYPSFRLAFSIYEYVHIPTFIAEGGVVPSTFKAVYFLPWTWIQTKPYCIGEARRMRSNNPTSWPAVQAVLGPAARENIQAKCIRIEHSQPRYTTKGGGGAWGMGRDQQGRVGQRRDTVGF